MVGFYIPARRVDASRKCGLVDIWIHHCRGAKNASFRRVEDGRIVDASGIEPLKSKVVRPIPRIDLPFIDGVNLREFSQITVNEFNPYSGFRDFLSSSGPRRPWR